MNPKWSFSSFMKYQWLVFLIFCMKLQYCKGLKMVKQLWLNPSFGVYVAKRPQINFLKFYGGRKGDVSYLLHVVAPSYMFEVAFDSSFYTSVFDFSGRNHLNKSWVEITFFRWSVTKNWLQTKNSIIKIDCEIKIFRKIFV